MVTILTKSGFVKAELCWHAVLCVPCFTRLIATKHCMLKFMRIECAGAIRKSEFPAKTSAVQLRPGVDQLCSRSRSWVQLLSESVVCILASSRWEPTLLGRPSPSEARLKCSHTLFSMLLMFTSFGFLFVHCPTCLVTVLQLAPPPPAL